MYAPTSVPVAAHTPEVALPTSISIPGLGVSAGAHREAVFHLSQLEPSPFKGPSESAQVFFYTL